MTEWFERTPGSPAAVGTDDPTMLLLDDGVPDWVRLPPELGQGQLKVLGHHEAECPLCHAASVRHLKLQEGYGVAECVRDGFVWYRTKETP